MTWLVVAAGAAIGAPLRYVVDRALQRRYESVFPWGTLVVNVIGSFVLGWVVAAASDGRLHDDVVLFAGVGFCGALTTFSTFSYETLRLLSGGAMRYALINVTVSMVAGLGAAALGWWLGT
jgi:CrcB protein